MAKIGALKMLMLNIEQAAANEASPLPPCEDGVDSCTGQPLVTSIIDCSNSDTLHDCGGKNSKACSARARHKPEEQSTATGGSGSAGTDLAAIAQAVQQILSEQRSTSAALEVISAALLASGTLCDGSTRATAPLCALGTRNNMKATTAFCSPDLLCRSRLIPTTHRIRLRWRRESCVEKSRKNSLRAENISACDALEEQSTRNVQSFLNVSSEHVKDSSCKKKSYESTSDTNFILPGEWCLSFLQSLLFHLSTFMFNICTYILVGFNSDRKLFLTNVINAEEAKCKRC